jgi:hypothetical protein
MPAGMNASPGLVQNWWHQQDARRPGLLGGADLGDSDGGGAGRRGDDRNTVADLLDGDPHDLVHSAGVSEKPSPVPPAAKRPATSKLACQARRSR